MRKVTIPRFKEENKMGQSFALQEVVSLPGSGFCRVGGVRGEELSFFCGVSYGDVHDSRGQTSDDRPPLQVHVSPASFSEHPQLQSDRLECAVLPSAPRPSSYRILLPSSVKESDSNWLARCYAPEHSSMIFPWRTAKDLANRSLGGMSKKIALVSTEGRRTSRNFDWNGSGDGRVFFEV